VDDCRGLFLLQGVSVSDCRGATIRVRLWLLRGRLPVLRGSLALDGGPAAITLDVHLEDRRVVDAPVDGGEGRGLVGEDPAPFAESLVGGDKERPAPLPSELQCDCVCKGRTP
jgi:hypothetical protein